MTVEIGISLRRPRQPAASAPESALEADDEARLVAALQRGEPRALELAYERHSRGVYSLALHLLGDAGAAEEVVQETFLKLWRHPNAYKPSRGRLLAWLLGVAHHHAVDLLRRRQLELRHRAGVPAGNGEGGGEGLDAFELVALDADPQSRLGALEQRQAVGLALAALPPPQRIPLVLAYYRGLTQAEIATLLAEPLGTIKTRMRLGLQQLRSSPALADQWSDPC